MATAAERSAAHLVDRVVPDVPVRQWVLTLPYRLRHLLAWDHALCRAVVGVYLRTVLAFLRHRARREGVCDGRGGAVAIIQRFGAALNLNVHVPALVLDGVFAKDGVDRVRFHRTPRLTSVEVAGVLATVARRIGHLLVRRGLAEADASEGATDPWAEEAPALAGIATAVGPRVGRARGAGRGARPAGRRPAGDGHARRARPVSRAAAWF